MPRDRAVYPVQPNGATRPLHRTMRRQIRNLLLFGPLLVVAGVLHGQVSEGWQETVILDERELEGPTTLVKDWRFHPGDDPAWADPDFDDSAWPLVLPSLENVDQVAGEWTGIGWFRRQIRATPEFGSSAGIFMGQAGASEIYLDGELVATFGKVSTDPEVEQARLPQYVASLTLEPGRDHVLAVRYSNAAGHVFRRDFRGFEMAIGEMQALTGFGIRMLRMYTAVTAASVGVFSAFAVLHLLLFAFQPKARENLYFAIFNGSIAGMFLAEHLSNTMTELAEMLVFYQASLTLALTMGLSALLVEYKVFKLKIGTAFYILVAAAAGVLVWIWTRPAFGHQMPVAVLLTAIFLLTMWLAITALAERQPDAWLISVGFLILTLSVFVTLLRFAGWIEVSPILTTFVGLGSLAICFSAYLTRRVARTNRELEAKLAEVKSLTERTIEQERWAAREEAERRVLEADNSRKTAELEEARKLQLAMLPHELPALPHFDIGVHMATANEVGGDYYDFAGNGDGSCTVVVGDATGHGLHAGMVVGAAKSLFQTCPHDLDLSTVLSRIETGLGTMHRREASMAMILLRLDQDHVDLASAGMPPVLVWRQATTAVEEIMLPSVPLGTLARTEYQRARIDLAPGDSLLVMTDGLAEVTDPQGDLLGYDRAAELFARYAHLTPAETIARIVGEAAEFQSDTPLQDDMTLLVFRSRG